MKACCKALVKRYLALIAGTDTLTRPGIALFCGECAGRVTYSNGTWITNLKEE